MESQNTYHEKIDEGIEAALQASSDIQAENIRLIDVSGQCEFGDYFIVLPVQSPRQMRAVVDEIESKLKILSLPLHHREGDNTSGWTLLDYGDLVVHVFGQEFREYYSLEDAWPDARTVRIIQ